MGLFSRKPEPPEKRAEREHRERLAAEVRASIKPENVPGMTGVVNQERGDSKLVCPHCNTTGMVTSRIVKRKHGVSGAKATGAVLTGGLSVVATGLSQKQEQTERTCRNCGTTWHVD